MKKTPSWVKLLVFVIVVLVVGSVLYVKRYAKPMADLKTEIAAKRDRITWYEEKIADHESYTKALKAYGATTLARTRDEFEHRFRTALNEISRDCGLQDITVDSSAPTGVPSPLLDARFKGGTGKTLKEAIKSKNKPDFAMFGGTISAEGSLDQVLRLMAQVGAQPWVHRIESFTIKPLGKDGDRFSLHLGVLSLYMPELAPDEPPAVVPLDPASEVAWMPIVNKNPFTRPAPPEPPVSVEVAREPEQPKPARVEPPKPPPPYGDWRLTAVVVSARGTEAWVVNQRNGHRRVLRPGDKLLGAVLVTASGERAVFEIDGSKYEIHNGQTLDQRRTLAG